MDYLRTYAPLLRIILIAACSGNEEQFNSGAATISLWETAMTVEESAGLCTVPIVVTGEHTGIIRMTLESEDHTAKEDENYIVTTETLLIPADQETINFEFKTIDDKDVNDDHPLDIETVDVKRASIGINNRLTVVIKDNGSSSYEMLSETWIFTGTASATNTSNIQVGFSVEVNTAGEDTEAYEYYLVYSNRNGFDPDNDIEWELSWCLHYKYDSVAQKIYLFIVPGENVVSYGPYTIHFRRLALDGSTFDIYRGRHDVETKTVIFENVNLIGDAYKDGPIQI